MAGQRGDATHVGTGGWMAWGDAGHALLSAQDEEDGISDWILDDGSGVGSDLVECLD
jgi:hypothetical protein